MQADLQGPGESGHLVAHHLRATGFEVTKTAE
jgi:hypothetical protein